MSKINWIIIFLTLFILQSCNSKTSQNKAPLFLNLSPDSTGIYFKNNINDSGKYNFFNLKNIFGGAGVSVGDINNDGLVDVFLAANDGECKLYLNKGNFLFEDITGQSGIIVSGGWTTGVTMADVNGDGFIDIYISRTDTLIGKNSKNLYFENNGNNSFTEKADEYGIADFGLTTQATFFDMDNDGDLDLYVLNTPVFDDDPNDFTFINTQGKDYSTSDKLYENIDGKFHDISLKAGLNIERGSGLGIVVSDINMDGWLDIYVANDWIENDKLYINQKNGTFKESLKEFATTTSYFSMGMDIVDVNNDGWADVFVADMAPMIILGVTCLLIKRP